MRGLPGGSCHKVPRYDRGRIQAACRASLTLFPSHQHLGLAEVFTWAFMDAQLVRFLVFLTPNIAAIDTEILFLMGVEARPQETPVA